MLGDDREKLDRHLPMRGELLWHQLLERREIDLLGLDEVHEIGEIGGKVGSLARVLTSKRIGCDLTSSVASAGVLLQAKNQPHQRETPRQRLDGRRRQVRRPLRRSPRRPR